MVLSPDRTSPLTGTGEIMHYSFTFSEDSDWLIGSIIWQIQSDSRGFEGKLCLLLLACWFLNAVDPVGKEAFCLRPLPLVLKGTDQAIVSLNCRRDTSNLQQCELAQNGRNPDLGINEALIQDISDPTEGLMWRQCHWMGERRGIVTLPDQIVCFCPLFAKMLCRTVSGRDHDVAANLAANDSSFISSFSSSLPAVVAFRWRLRVGTDRSRFQLLFWKAAGADEDE